MTTHEQEQKRAYYLKNRERILANVKKRQAAHREERAAYLRAYRQQHRETLAAKQRVYMQGRREELQAYHRTYREKNKAVLKEKGHKKYLDNKDKKTYRERVE